MKPYRNYTDFLDEKLSKDPILSLDYLNAALQNEETDILLIALKDVVRATLGGMTALSEETNLSRESLYRTLSQKGNPRLSSLVAILDALGYRLAIQSKKQRKKKASKKSTRAPKGKKIAAKKPSRRVKRAKPSQKKKP